METNQVDISGLSKATVLMALYNASKPLGMGFLNPNCGSILTEAEAEDALSTNSSGYFDYLRGRVMKISLKSDVLDTYLYNRDNGYEAAEQVIEQLRKQAV